MLNWRCPRNPKSGGAERVTLGYLRALAARGHEVYWFAFAFPGGAREEVINGVKIVRGGGMVSSIIAARSWCRTQVPFDLVMDQHHGIPWFSPWWCAARHVSYIHEVLGPIWQSFYPWPLSMIGRWQERWTHWLYRNKQFWTACESTEDALRRHGVQKIQIIRYGVWTEALPKLPEKPMDSPIRLLVVSRLAPNKRIDHAVKALAVLKRRGVAAALTVVGRGEDEPALRALSEATALSSLITFTGEVTEAEKERHMREAHWLLHTSQREGWGLNIIEANAMGTPAIVYPVEGLRESTVNGVTGLWAKDETPESLAETIVQGSQSKEGYQQLRVGAWERAKEFHWNRILPPACDWLEEAARGALG